MSAAVRYNFTNHSFSASERITNIAKYDPADVLNDFSSILGYLPATTAIADQTNLVAKSFVNYLKRVKRAELSKNAFSLEILNAGFADALSKTDATYLMFTKPNG